jgi:hypothetical protein
MPEVAIYDGEPNAFATGASKNNSLVAVSTGLLQSMTREEAEAFVRSRAGTWDGPISGAELLKLTRGA